MVDLTSEIDFRKAVMDKNTQIISVLKSINNNLLRIASAIEKATKFE